MYAVFCGDVVNAFMQKMSFYKKRTVGGSVSGYRCLCDGRSRGREFNPGLVPYFLGD